MILNTSIWPKLWWKSAIHIACPLQAIHPVMHSQLFTQLSTPNHILPTVHPAVHTQPYTPSCPLLAVNPTIHAQLSTPSRLLPAVYPSARTQPYTSSHQFPVVRLVQLSLPAACPAIHSQPFFQCWRLTISSFLTLHIQPSTSRRSSSHPQQAKSKYPSIASHPPQVVHPVISSKFQKKIKLGPLIFLRDQNSQNSAKL